MKFVQREIRLKIKWIELPRKNAKEWMVNVPTTSTLDLSIISLKTFVLDICRYNIYVLHGKERKIGTLNENIIWDS